MTQTVETIGFIGLGNMGGGMAANLTKAGFTVLGFDLNEAAVGRAAATGVRPGADIAAVAGPADVVVTMLPDTPEVSASILGPDGVRQHARPGTLVIDSSTIAPATTDELNAALTASGLAFMDAPVGRGPAQAADGTLLFMIGAGEDDLAGAQPLLDAMGDTFIHCGGVGSGIRTKLVNNLLSQATCQLSAEAVALGLKLGLSLETLLKVMSGSIGNNGFISGYWPTKVLAGDTEPGFAIRLSAKDLGLAAAMAEAAGAAIPTGAAAAKAVRQASKDHGHLDVSALLEVACDADGIKLPKD